MNRGAKNVNRKGATDKANRVLLSVITQANKANASPRQEASFMAWYLRLFQCKTSDVSVQG